MQQVNNTTFSTLRELQSAFEVLNNARVYTCLCEEQRAHGTHPIITTMLTRRRCLHHNARTGNKWRIMAMCVYARARVCVFCFFSNSIPSKLRSRNTRIWIETIRRNYLIITSTTTRVLEKRRLLTVTWELCRINPRVCCDEANVFDPTINRAAYTYIYSSRVSLARTRAYSLLNAKYKIAGYGGTFFFLRPSTAGRNEPERIGEWNEFRSRALKVVKKKKKNNTTNPVLPV